MIRTTHFAEFVIGLEEVLRADLEDLFLRQHYLLNLCIVLNQIFISIIFEILNLLGAFCRTHSV